MSQTHQRSNGAGRAPLGGGNLSLHITLLQREYEGLVAAYPELAEDESLRADVVEGETGAHEVLSRILSEERASNAMLVGIKQRQDDLAARKARFERRKEAMRELAFKLMKAVDLPKVMLPEATVSISKKAASVEIIDEALLTKQFLRMTTSPDKTAIKEALISGKKVRGARMGEPGETLSIRAA